MCSTEDGCWASPRNNNSLRQNQTTPEERQEHRPQAGSIKRLSHPTESFLLARIFLFTANWIINIVLCVMFTCVVIVVVPVCFFVRRLVLYCSLRHHRGGKLSKMSASEAVWLQNCVNTAPVSNIFFLFEGNVTVDEVRTLVSDRWLHLSENSNRTYRFRKFTQFPIRVLTGFGWKEFENLNSTNYLVENDGKSSVIPVDLKDISGGSSLKDLEKLWRVVLFPNFEDSEDTGLLFQIHESIGDIFPSTRVVLESLDYKTVYLKKDCYLLGRLYTILSACFCGPFVILQRLLMRNERNLFVTDGELNGRCQVLWSGAIDYKAVKRIKDVTRTQVDIVLLSCLAGAIRSFLKKCNVQNPDDVLVCVRTDVRPQHTKLKLDNKFSVAFIRLPVGTEGAVPRLWETRRRIDTFSYSLESVIFYGFIKLCLLLFPLSMVRKLINYLTNKVSCTVTQTPGPNVPVYLNGKMAKMMTSWAPRKTASGLSISITSHGGQIHLGLVTHHPQLHDPAVLLAEFDKEVTHLSSHLGKRTLPSHLRWRLKAAQPVDVVRVDGEVREEENV